jgi:phosphotransferase system enzyme I (PtsP)
MPRTPLPPHRHAAPVSRRLLARVRDVMAGPESAEQRLSRVVAVIAAEMVAEVCSVYVRRAGDVLELFATQGLKPEAVHRTRLRVGEGIVGDVAAHARPLALADAQAHPNFAYRPETGEEIYHSMMGVPVLRGGNVIGVLAVQNRTRRHYAEEEVETLQTVAMVLAELVASGELVSPDELAPVDGIALKPLRVEGVRLNAGVGIGVALLHQPRFVVARVVAEDPAVEHERLRRAFEDMRGAIDTLFAAEGLSAGGEHRDVLETYRMIARDAGWLGRIAEAIDGGLTAEAAVQRVQNDVRARLSQAADPYLRERVHDFDDLANRLLQHLVGSNPDAPRPELPPNVVLVARSLGPAELLDYDYARLRGLVLEEGSPTAHVAIVARALDIPVVGQVRDMLTRVEPGDTVVVDADNGQVLIRPGDDVQQAFVENIKLRAARIASYAALRDLPSVTRDGAAVSININAGLLVDLAHLHEFGADGVGLYRTEIPFMVRPTFPDVPTQQRIYAKVIEQAGGKPVVFRTLDVGGDKVLPYWNKASEENPAMGWRAIRIALDRPAMLRQQLRALIRATAGGELRLMFPMIAEVAEFLAARALLDRELERERKRTSRVPSSLRIGAMIEVPSLVYQLPVLLHHVDFVSIGSNDLLQFLFASDRGNPHVAERYDVLSPPVLRCLGAIVVACDRAGVPVALCGEMAGRPLEAMALLGLGLRTLSMAPPSVGPVKTMVRSALLKPLARYLDSLLDAPDRSVREKLRGFARDHGVVI